MNVSMTGQNNLLKQAQALTDLPRSKNANNPIDKTMTNASPLSLTQAVGRETEAIGPASLTEAVKNLVDSNPVQAFTQAAGITLAQTQTQAQTLAPEADSLSNRQIDDINVSLGLGETAERMGPNVNEVADDIVNRILQNKDHDKNSMLTQQELKMSDDRFQQLDSNSDGLVSAEELTASLTRDIGQAARFDPNINIDAFAEAWFNAINTDNNGNLADLNKQMPMPVNERMDESTGSTRSLTDVKHMYNDRMSSTPNNNKLTDIANQVGKRLDESGFTNKPPTNIRSLVDSLRLDASSKGSLMQMLSARYPHGLGISLFG